MLTPSGRGWTQNASSLHHLNPLGNAFDDQQMLPHSSLVDSMHACINKKFQSCIAKRVALLSPLRAARLEAGPSWRWSLAECWRSPRSGSMMVRDGQLTAHCGPSSRCHMLQRSFPEVNLENRLNSLHRLLCQLLLELPSDMHVCKMWSKASCGYERQIDV